jgi:hypothetical protein
LWCRVGTLWCWIRTLGSRIRTLCRSRCCVCARSLFRLWRRRSGSRRRSRSRSSRAAACQKKNGESEKCEPPHKTNLSIV